MAELIIETLSALVLLLFWLTVVSVLVRPFGVRLPLAPFAKRRSAFQALTFSQYLMIGGVMYFGCGMLIMTILSRYLEWKYWHGAELTSDNVVRDVLQSMLSGVLFGLISWFSLRA